MVVCVLKNMFSCVNVRSIVLVIVFAFCQVIGTMCLLPDVPTRQDIVAMTQEDVSCPMDGTIMCPPSITSSPERQVSHALFAHIDDGPALLFPAAMFAVYSSRMPWTWSSAYSLVPISIASSSVLRI